MTKTRQVSLAVLLEHFVSATGEMEQEEARRKAAERDREQQVRLAFYKNYKAQNQLHSSSMSQDLLRKCTLSMYTPTSTQRARAWRS